LLLGLATTLDHQLAGTGPSLLYSTLCERRVKMHVASASVSDVLKIYYCKCFRWMLHMLQWLYTYVASVCFQCFICVFRRILQVYLSRCCICFTHMLQFICMLPVFAMVFQTFFMCFSSVSEACFKCFIYLQTYVASVASGCFKSRSVWRSDPCVGVRNAGVGGGVLA
jgi:hypothetical protein